MVRRRNCRSGSFIQKQWFNISCIRRRYVNNVNLQNNLQIFQNSFDINVSTKIIVYITGDNEKSNNLLQLINEKGVTEVLESEHFVAIKIKANSVSYHQFSELCILNNFKFVIVKR